MSFDGGILRWTEVIGHDEESAMMAGRYTSIQPGGGFPVWHIGSVSTNARGSRRCGRRASASMRRLGISAETPRRPRPTAPAPGQDPHRGPGREIARWQHIQQALDIKVYFCDPHSWQRPTNEQTSGLLRRWLPQGTDLNIGAVRLAVIEDHLSAMPRKLHDWDSAHSVYAALTCNHR